MLVFRILFLVGLALRFLSPYRGFGLVIFVFCLGFEITTGLILLSFVRFFPMEILGVDVFVIVLTQNSSLKSVSVSDSPSL